MGMEVIWIRLFTPYVGPLVYSFAMIQHAVRQSDQPRTCPVYLRPTIRTSSPAQTLTSSARAAALAAGMCWTSFAGMTSASLSTPSDDAAPGDPRVLPARARGRAWPRHAAGARACASGAAILPTPLPP